MDELHIITTESKLLELKQYLSTNISHVNNLVAFDTEADGKDCITNTVIGYSISLFDNEGFYVPFLTWTDDQGLATEAPQPIPKEGHNTEEKLYPCLSTSGHKVAMEILNMLKDYRTLMHNAPYDVIICRRNFNLDLLPSLHCDTLLLKHTIDCEPPHGLKECGVKYFGEHAKDEQTELGGSIIRNGGKYNKSDKWIWRGDLYYVGKYGAMDTVLTLKLYHRLDPELDKIKLRSFFYDLEVMPLLKHNTIDMKDLGFPISVGHFMKTKLALESEIDDLERQLYAEISDVIGPLEQELLDKKYPPKNAGRFAEALILEAGLPIPVNPKTGTFTVSAKVKKDWTVKVSKTCTADQLTVVWYINDECDKVPTHLFHRAQRRLWEENNDGQIVNLNSADQFAEIVGKKWGVKSPEKSESGKPSFTASIIEKITIDRMRESEGILEDEAQEKFHELLEGEVLPNDVDWFIKFLRKKKLEKILSTFIEGILELHINGVIHADFQQFGTNSGRYSTKSPNLQQLPAHSALGKSVKQGFVAEVK